LPSLPPTISFPPSPSLLQVEDTCVANHLNERKVKAEEEDRDRGRWLSMADSVEEEEEIHVEEEEGEEPVAGGSGEEIDGEFPDTALTVAHIGGDQ
jgi:hypothetical protein